MRAVLYADEDFEPITVLELEQWAVDRLRKRGQIYFAILPPLPPLVSLRPEDPVKLEPIHQVCIWGEWVMRKGVEHMLLVTREDEHALRLRSALLPGQRQMYQDYFQQGFLEGLYRALR